MIKVGIGQDSHRIVEQGSGNSGSKLLMLGGIRFETDFHLAGNSDADVVLHAITNAVSGITCRPVIGPVADALCKQGINDSVVYLAEALRDLEAMGYRLVHLSISMECKKPRIIPRMDDMRTRIAQITKMEFKDVALTATTGEELTDFGKGLGIQVLTVATAMRSGSPTP